ncbi:MAG: phosphoglucosamine mutase [Parasphingorhabdus sp.]
MTRKFFGTDGIRGRVGTGAITPDQVLKLGWAAGRVLCEGSDSPKVVIGKDTRVSGYMLESALEAGLSAAGVNVSLIGPMPTPGIAYLTRTARASAGIVISASHNSYQDNGIKFFSGNGCKLDDEIELRIEKAMEETLATVESSELGKAERFSDAPGRYIEYCKSTFPAQLSLKGIKLVVDCANGAAYDIAPHVFEELGAEVVAIFNQPNGFNINDNCGSTQPSALCDAVKQHGANLGVGLDGDGDRVVMVDETGALVDGDQLLYVMAGYRRRIGVACDGLAGTLMSNFGLEVACRELGIDFIRANVGDRYVLQVLREKGWQLGGEASGHIICLDKSTTGDGIVAALEVLAEVAQSGRPLSELVSGMVKFPQVMLNVRVDSARLSNNEILAHSNVRDALAKVEGLLDGEGRVVLRSSGTEPLIRVMVEGRHPDQVREFASSIAATVQTASNS